MALVPHSDQIEAPGEHARLCEAEEESCSEETAVIDNKALANCDEAEEEHTSGQPYVGSEPLQEDIGGDLTEAVGDKEDDESGIVFIILVNLEFLGETKDLGVGYIDAVNKGAQVQDTEGRNEAPVDLCDQSLLGSVLERREVEIVVVKYLRFRVIALGLVRILLVLFIAVGGGLWRDVAS